MLATLVNFATSYGYTDDYQYTYTQTQPDTVYTSSGEAGLALALLVPIALITLAFAAFMIVVMWKLYTKAGRPGWASLIPIYSTWVMAEMAGKPGWWGLYPLVAWIPVVGWIVGAVVSIIIALGMARRFGKSDLFGVIGLWLFAIVGYAILAFGSATYRSDDKAGGGAMPPEPPYPQVPEAPKTQSSPERVI